MTDTEFKQFLSDVMTAAGLVAHGKQSKALAERLGEGVMKLYATPPSVPPKMVHGCGLHGNNHQYIFGWNDCREAMLSAPKPEDMK